MLFTLWLMRDVLYCVDCACLQIHVVWAKVSSLQSCLLRRGFPIRLAVIHILLMLTASHMDTPASCVLYGPCEVPVNKQFWACCKYTCNDLRGCVCGLQGLDDHAHKPTLERLPKDKLVVGSPAAATVAAQLGFSNVISLDHGQRVRICHEQLEVEAIAGGLQAQRLVHI